MGFASFLCSGFTAVAVINPPEKLQTIYVLKKKILLFLGLKFMIIESGFKSRAGYSGVRTVNQKIIIVYEQS